MEKKFVYLFLAIALCLSFGVVTEQMKGASPRIQVAGKEGQIDHADITHWSYEGDTGPEHWGKLNPAFIACKNGRKQSPINIEFSKMNENDKIRHIQVDYEPTPFSLINNGHTIQANPTILSNRLIVEGKEYKLTQFHVHTPSEHQLNGQSYDMELHFVHQDTNGKYAVLAVMIQEGKENETLVSLWRRLPKTVGEVSAKESVDLQALLPSNQPFYSYSGSLTTPPCTEGVKWFVMGKSINMSKEQIQAFTQIFPNNSRPVQPLNKRDIMFGELVAN